MAKGKNLLKPGTRKKKPVIRKQRSKALDPDWSTALQMSGQAYHKHKMVSVDWYYQERKPVELFPDLLAWMKENDYSNCLLYTSPSPRDRTRSRMPSSA